jgi:GR25 family glycosyltransferase involved in LPS biosynthesis
MAGDDMCMIMEDDVSFVNCNWQDIQNRLSELSQLDPAWELLFLGINADPDELKRSGAPQKLSDSLYRIYSGFATHAYIVRATAFKKVIEVWKTHSHLAIPHDVVYSQMLIPHTHAYCVNPLMAVQRPSFSQHLNHYIDYNYFHERWLLAINS